MILTVTGLTKKYWSKIAVDDLCFELHKRVNFDMLNDERLISIGKRLVAAIPFGTSIYICIAIVSLLLCVGMAYIRRVDRR